MSRRLAWSLLSLHMLVLAVGTQMPNAWRQGVEQIIQAPFNLSPYAHFVVFGSMALVLSMHPLTWPAGRVLLLALVLALATEAFQFFAIDRHPRWIDVAIDMAGAVLALVLLAARNKLAGLNSPC